MPDQLLQQLSNIDTIEAADRVILTLAAEILKAPNNQRRKNLNEMRKLIQHTVADKLLPAKDFDQRLEGLEAAWIEICEMFKAYLPPEAWGKIEGKTIATFGKVRLREGLKK